MNSNLSSSNYILFSIQDRKSASSLLLSRIMLLMNTFQLKPLQNKKGQKIWGTREKSSPFIRKMTAFFSGTPNFFGPSYFEAALADHKLVSRLTDL